MSPREQLSFADGRPLTLAIATPRAALRERRESLAEARWRKRRLERETRLGGLAPVQRALAGKQCVPLGVESLAHQAELVLARLEPSLEPAELAFPGRRGHVDVGKLRHVGCCAGAPSLALELNAECGELLLDRARGAVALVEKVPLGGCEVALGGSLRGAGLGLRQPRSQLVFPLFDPRRVGCELGGARFELALARLERVCTLERGTLSRHDRVGAAGRVLPRLGRLSAAEPAFELCKLSLARGNRLGALTERLLQPLQLGASIRLAGVPFRRELPREPEELRPIEVRVGFVGSVAPSPRRPRVEALLPAVYFRSICSASTASWCPFSIIRC
jgi:hypothetical protein